jgi:hypothetical protein
LDWHRRLGVFGAALAGAMVVLALLVATDALARGFVPPGSKLDPKSFYSIPVFETAVFCVLIVWALRARADGAAHKRLMLIATISLMGPAINRWAFLPSAHRGLVTSVIVDFLILLIAGFDLWSRRRIHRATVQGGLFMIIAHQLMFPIGLTPVWHRFRAAATICATKRAIAARRSRTGLRSARVAATCRHKSPRTPNRPQTFCLRRSGIMASTNQPPRSTIGRGGTPPTLSRDRTGRRPKKPPN